MTKTMRILTFLLLMVVGTGQAMAIAESNPRVKFIYASEHGTAFASGADNDGKVTITITPDGDWCCFDGDVTAKVTANTNMAQAPRRTQPGVQLGDAIDVTCTATNVFTLTLPKDENLNATVTVSFREKLDNNITVSLDDWTYGQAANTPQVENNLSSNGPTYTYSDAENGDYSSTVPSLAGTYWVKASVDANADYKAGEAKASFKIEQKALTITAGDATKLYDGYELTALTYTNTDLAEGDRIDAVTITGTQTEVGESNNVPSDAVIKNSNNDDVTASYDIEYVNGKLTVEDVSVKFSVVNIANGEAIAGATVQLIDENDNILKEWTSSTAIHTVDGLYTGKQFTVHESIAPDGYTLAGDFTFTVNADGSITTSGSKNSDNVLLVENRKTLVKISVVDTDTKAAIAGATIQLKDNEGNVLKEWTSTTDIYEIEGLTTGFEYTIHEAEAPNSYLISDDNFFTIDGTGYITYNGTKANNVLLVENVLQTVTLSPASATYIAGTDQKPTVTVTVGGSVIDQNDYTVSYKLNDQTVTEFVNSGTYTVSIADKEGGYNLRDVDVPFTINGAPVMVTVKNDKDEDVEVPAATGDATITLDQDGITLTLITPDENTEPQTVSIPQPVLVDHVEILRNFIKGKAATLYLPFKMVVGNISGGTFHTFTSVDQTTTPWTVNYSEALDASFVLQANTPYIFLPNGSNGKMTVNNTAQVTVSTANPHTTTQGVWEFIGTHSPIVWQSGHADLGRVFGFAAEEKNGCEIGQFVKAGAGASIDPMRGYLRYTASLAPAMDGSNTTAVDELPATMRVVIGGETTSLVSIDNGQLTIDNDVWYTLDGRKLDKQPTAKGVYINGGRKVVVK